MANYLPTYCERRIFLSAPRPENSITHNIWPTKEKLGTETRAASGDERLSLLQYVYLLFQPIWQRQGF